MNNTKVSWTAFKSFVQARGLSIQFIESSTSYNLIAFDDSFILECFLIKDPSDTTDLLDFENNFKSNGNKQLENKDVDGAVLGRLKIAKSGAIFQLNGFSFESSVVGSGNCVDVNGNDLGFVTLKLYKADDSLITDQSIADTDCVKSVLDWEPTFNFEIIGGLIEQVDPPSENIKLFVIGVPDIPENYGGSAVFVNNINIKFIKDALLLDGRVPKYMIYNSSYHTNKFRFILIHPAGFKHQLQIALTLFK